MTDVSSDEGRRAGMRIGVALFEDTTELDWAGPWEVLAAWSRGWPGDGVEVFSMAQHLDPVRCAGGLRVLPHLTWEQADNVDVLVYPGGQGTRRQLDDTDVHEWLRRQQHSGALMTSVCTGALVYAAAGLLHNRPATTHWRSLELLASLDPTIDVRGGERFVDDGDVVTSAGVSAGIDMALHLVARLHSPQRARQVRRQIQYDPEPPV